MASRVVIELVDDLDGEVIDEGKGETVVFFLDGQGYELDLRSQHANDLRAALQPFVTKARRLPASKGRRTRKH